MTASVKKVLSVCLALCLACSLLVPVFAGLSGDYSTPIPTVYLHGQGGVIYADKNNTKSAQIQDINIPDGYVEDVAKSLIRPLAKGLLLNNWDDWVDGFVEGVAPLLEPQALDENGEASNGSGVYTSSGRHNSVQADGTYKLSAYSPLYDWRLDPYVIAEDIHTYVHQVIEATGAPSVNLVGRSIGASVVMAYLELYGTEGLETVVLYCPSLCGMEVMSKIFAGKVKVDPEGINAFADYYISSGQADDMADDETLQLLLDVVSLSVSMRVLDIPSNMLDRIYAKVYGEVYPRLLVKAYGSMPSFWSLVGDEDYEDAKAAIFGGQEDVYAGLIEKIDRFHYNNLNRSAEIISSLVEDGAKIQIVAKYGVPTLPVIENCSMQSDMLTSVYSATLGAVCADYGKTLDSKYISVQKKLNDGKYISADRVIDASTCLLPDHTWFVKNLGHRSMPDGVNLLFDRMLNFEGYTTVFDDPEIPQFVYYVPEDDTIVPLTADLEAPAETRSFFTRLINVFRYVFNAMRNLFRRNAD